VDPFLVFVILWGGIAVGFKFLQRGQPRQTLWWISDRDIPPASRLQIWRGAAAACGLNMVGNTSRWAWRRKLEAQADTMEVRFEGTEREKVGTRIVVSVSGPPLFGDVSIRRAEGEPGAGFRLGDEAFDSTFSIGGPMRLLCVLLDAEARRLLLRVNAKSRVEVVGGELQAEMADIEVPFILPLLLDLGRRFAQKMDVVQSLVDNVQRDPEAGVRLSNLLLLIRECAWGPKTDETLRIACSDPSPPVRVRAAIELGPEGRGVLLELAESTHDDECSAQAMRALGHELPFERTTAIFDQAWRDRRIQTACACLEALGSGGTAEAVDVLAKVLTQEESELSAAAAEALGRTASATAEPLLIPALSRRRRDLRVAAAEALGHVGSVAAVLPLKESAERFWWDADLARATRQAIAEIQSRLPRATPGQLSLVGAEAGQLSLAQAEKGQLSLATDPSGQLSLSSDEAGRLRSAKTRKRRKPAPGGAA
jgi:HEAT repeat protein